jgi:site-specific recombinase XerD
MDINDFISDLSLRGGISPQTVKAYKADLSFFGTYLKDRNLKLRQVTYRVVGEFKVYMTTLKGRSNTPSLAPATIARRLAVLASLFKYLCALNPKRKNPFQVFKDLNPRQRLPRDLRGKAVDDATMEALMVGIDNLRDRALFSLAVASGLRVSELAQLDIDGIEEECQQGRDGTERVFGSGMVVGKGNKERRFYFDNEAIDAIKAYLETRTDSCPALFLSERKTRLSVRAIQDTLATWCRRLGIKHIHVHAMRHTFATNLANANIDALVLQSLMGHASFETTTGYFRLAEDMKARQYYSAMEFTRGPKT